MTIESLANEIGIEYRVRFAEADFLSAWTRRLALIVEQHTWPQLHAYGDSVLAWTREIAAADADKLTEVCARVRQQVAAVDDYDGWPEDRAGNALVAVCLCWRFALEDNSRWPAEASSIVWDFCTGARAFNDVTLVSKRAWQRQIFTEVTGAMVLSPKAAEMRREGQKQ